MKKITKEVFIAIIASVIAAAAIAVINSLLHPKYKVGEIVSFGQYEQNNGKEPIEWYVLDEKDGSYLLLSRYILDARCFNDNNVDISWEKSTLRTWLNTEFMDEVFTSSEKNKIQTVINSNPNNEKYGTIGGNATKDQIFLLSIPEAEKYLSLEMGLGYSTNYAVVKGAVSYDAYQASNLETSYSENDALEVIKILFKDVEEPRYIIKTKCVAWYLRSPGCKQNYAAQIRNKHISEVFSSVSELISYSGAKVDFYMGGIRPALWYKP